MLSQAEEIVALRRATDETKAMVEERFPFVVEVGANDDFASFRWPAAAAGLLARGVAIMDTTAALAEHAQELADASELHLVAEPLVECFVDANGNEPQPFNAVLIATFNRGVVEQALPYTGEALAKHEPVSWALNEQHVFPESWYRHPYTGLIELAWSDSPEFAGQEIGEKSAVDQGDAE